MSFQCNVAQERSDIVTIRESVTFSPGDPNEKTAAFSVNNDRILEVNETYFLNLRLTQPAVIGGARLGPRDRAEVTIIDDDSKITDN